MTLLIGLLGIILFILLGFLLVSLAYPAAAAAVLRRPLSRLQLLGRIGGSAFGLFALIGILSLTQPQAHTAPSASPSPTTATSTSTASPTAAHSASQAADTAAAARSILSAATDHYDALLAQGKQALGTAQYPSAESGTKALADPTSAASRFSSFNKQVTRGDDETDTEAFKKVQELYGDGGVPGSAQTGLDAWTSDIGSFRADLASWVSTALDWQISSASGSQLSQAESKVTGDLAKARADIQEVK